MAPRRRGRGQTDYSLRRKKACAPIVEDYLVVILVDGAVVIEVTGGVSGRTPVFNNQIEIFVADPKITIDIAGQGKGQLLTEFNAPQGILLIGGISCGCSTTKGKISVIRFHCKL